MTKRWIGLLPCASIVLVLAASCSSSDGGSGGGSAGLGGNAGVAGSPEGGTGGTEQGAGTGGEAGATAGAAGTDIGTAGGGGSPPDESGGAAGSGGAPIPVDPPLAPSAIPDLAFWLDGTAMSYSDIDANYPTAVDSGRIRSILETLPLTGAWQAPSPAERPLRELGALNLRPIATKADLASVDEHHAIAGYYVTNNAGVIQTDNSTVAISFVPLNGKYGPPAGGVAGRIGTSPQSLGLYFAGDQAGLYFNHTSAVLNKHFPRGVHTTILVRFNPTGVDVQYDIAGFRSSESIVAAVAHETASNFTVGYDSNNNADMYAYVSQVIGVNRAVSDSESNRVMTWLSAQPIPQAFPVSKPLVAIIGDSIAIGDQVPGWQSWAFSMLADLSDTHPDVQLLNAAKGGSGVPTVKNSDYSDFVLPWYSASRTTNILIVAAGTNDLANGANLSDIQDRYWGLLDAARATGWKTVACTLLPRSDAAAATTFETARTAFNAELVAHWASHADALANVAGISGLGAAGDSNNTTYYSVDKIHPLAPGHALLEPVYRAAVAGLL